MGRRGKQRAKQAKAARDLKYHTIATDFNELERELGGNDDDLDMDRGSSDTPSHDASEVSTDERAVS